MLPGGCPARSAQGDPAILRSGPRKRCASPQEKPSKSMHTGHKINYCDRREVYVWFVVRPTIMHFLDFRKESEQSKKSVPVGRTARPTHIKSKKTFKNRTNHLKSAPYGRLTPSNGVFFCNLSRIQDIIWFSQNSSVIATGCAFQYGFWKMCLASRHQHHPYISKTPSDGVRPQQTVFR